MERGTVRDEGPVHNDQGARKLLEAGLALASELDFDLVLQRIIELAVEITGARYAALGIMGPDDRIVEFLTTGISAEQRAHIGHLPVGEGILGALIGDQRPLRLANISEDPRSVGFPANHPPMRTEDDERALVILAAHAGVAIQNARLYEQATTRERWLAAVRDVTHAILEQINLDDVLRLAAERARELAKADFASIAVPYGVEGSSLLIRTAVGHDAESLEGHVYPREGSISGEVIASGKPVATDVSRDERESQPIDTLGHMGPALFLPIGSRASAFGTLCVARGRDGQPFPGSVLGSLEAFAGQVAVAIEYDQALRELRRLAIMEDRERIAKELHDGVIQSLFAVGMGLQATATMSGDPDLEERIETAVNELDRVIRDLRNYIFGLRPGILADRQLDQALRQLVEEFAGRTGVLSIVDVDTRTASELASSAADIIQFVREALSNVGRHAQATSARISLIPRGGRALLQIDDDGRGFDQNAASRRGGNGLRNLADRAAALGGELTIESSAEAGTTVRVDVPI
jgi:signal transduction histidine kinase